MVTSSIPSNGLHIDWASHQAAKHAVENWHYSEVMPAGKLVKVGVWEDGKFIGVVLFGRGANNNIGSPYGLSQTETAELVRIALREHKAPVSKIVAIAIRFLRKQSPGLKLIISYADPAQGHHGGIYQAGNWVYVGVTKAQQEVMVDGKIMHKRTANSLFGTIKGLEKSPLAYKHKYLMPLDAGTRSATEPLRKPHPKRTKEVITSTPCDDDGATPIRPLH